MQMKWQLMENAVSFSDKLKLVKFILSNDKFTNGEKVKELENSWNNWLGSKHSLFVSSGSTANFLLIASIKEKYNLKAGDKVLVPACTWMTNVAPIIQLGLTPVFCDIQFNDFSFDREELQYISNKHKNIKLIFVTHLLGFTSTTRDSDLLNSLFPEAIIIDDVCESHGCTSYDGRKIGADSLGATFSTYFGHHLTSVEGGFVSTNDAELYDLMKMKRSHGMARESVNYSYYADLYKGIDKSFLFITDGYNFRNTEINAVLGLSQLKKLDKSIKIRNENYKNFCNITKTFWHNIMPMNYIESSSNFCFPLICNNEQSKKKLQSKLQKNNIEYRPIVSGNLLRHPFLKGYTICSKKKHLNVDILHKNGIYLGNNQFVNKTHLNKLEEILDQL